MRKSVLYMSMRPTTTTFDYAGHWDGDHYGVPIFVPTRSIQPERQSGAAPLFQVVFNFQADQSTPSMSLASRPVAS